MTHLVTDTLCFLLRMALDFQKTCCYAIGVPSCVLVSLHLLDILHAAQVKEEQEDRNGNVRAAQVAEKPD